MACLRLRVRLVELCSTVQHKSCDADNVHVGSQKRQSLRVDALTSRHPQVLFMDT